MSFSNTKCKLKKAFKNGYNKALDDAIRYFEKHAHEVYDHVSARDFICDRLEELKNQN